MFLQYNIYIYIYSRGKVWRKKRAENHNNDMLFVSQLEMEDDDVIEVYQEQTGGYS